MRRAVVLVCVVACGGSKQPNPAIDAAMTAGDAAKLDAATDAAGIVDAPDAPPPCTACRLLAITPSTAHAGDTITLDGTFAAGAQVVFPGASAPVAATMLGANRATVIVPADATAGPLVVTIGATTTNALAFRRASFAIGLANGFDMVDQVDHAHTSQTLANEHRMGLALARGGYVYVIGGDDYNAFDAGAIRARLNADGTLGTFAGVAGAGNEHGHFLGTAVVAGDWVYELAGRDAGAATGIVERATFDATDNLGAFTTLATPLLAARDSYPVAWVSGKYVYVAGGFGAAGAVTTTERAEILADGTLSAFAVDAGAALVVPCGSARAMVTGGFVYVFGGIKDSTHGAGTQRAAIAGDGTVGAFEAVPGLGVGSARISAGIARAGDRLYAIGGSTLSAFTNEVDEAIIASDGTVGAFTALPRGLTTTREYPDAVVAGNYLYVLGGDPPSGAPRVERAMLDRSGDIAATFATQPASALVDGRAGTSAVVLGDYLYVMAGVTSTGATKTIERAPIAADGTLGAFAAAPSALVETGSQAMVLTTSSHLCVLGGFDASMTGESPSIDCAPLAADGTPGMFAFTGGVTSVERAGATEFVAGTTTPYLYLVGGTSNGGTPATSIEKISFLSDGTLNLASDTGSTLADGRTGAGGWVFAGQAYVADGGAQTLLSGGAGANLSTQSPAPLVARTGINGGVAWLSPYLYLVGGDAGGTLERTAASATSDGHTALGAFASAGALVTPRTLHATVVLGNYLYVIGGADPTTGAPLASVERVELR